MHYFNTTLHEQNLQCDKCDVMGAINCAADGEPRYIPLDLFPDGSSAIDEGKRF